MFPKLLRIQWKKHPTSSQTTHITQSKLSPPHDERAVLGKIRTKVCAIAYSQHE
ncbi:hypothetical protein [Planktothrix sp. FACHB-1355]|uniref:hypothetical protein n=1 Tax=Planktothrix sp. FACHB-1355 TaxID=2692854 RepID=UPI001688901B|nr:hypothetical protein [Planktothrix sp. FACHB-1355]